MMHTVKEVSEITGISIRTLHYYDEIGLLKPTKVNEAGYRFYDEKALEKLQQILFFREFDLPLKDIQSIMDHPTLDRTQILLSQKKMLERKQERLGRIIKSIEHLLEGESSMDFEVFQKEDFKKMYESIVAKLTKEQKEVFIEQYGSMEAYEKHFMENAADERVQKNLAKVAEWYGDKESALATATNPDNSKIMEEYAKRLDTVMKKLAGKMGCEVHSNEVIEIMSEYDLVSKQLYQMKDVKAMMLEMAKTYKSDERLQKASDQMYGEGYSVFLAEALEAFYQH